MREIYELRRQFLSQFADYLLKNYEDSSKFLCWLSVLENCYPGHYKNLYQLVAQNDNAWNEAVSAFALETRELRTKGE